MALSVGLRWREKLHRAILRTSQDRARRYCGPMTAVHWFRRDLRLADNPALAAAVDGAHDGATVALFVLDPVLWAASGLPRQRHLVASLAALSASMDGRLTIRVGEPSAVVAQVAAEIEATEVHVTQSYEPYGTRRDARVATALSDVGARLVPIGSPYAISPGRVLTQAGSPYRVFTPYRAAWLAHGWRRPAPLPHAPQWVALTSQELPGIGAAEPAGSGDRAGEQAALDRWHDFLDRVDTYDVDRDRPDLDLTSRLSVALK